MIVTRLTKPLEIIIRKYWNGLAIPICKYDQVFSYYKKNVSPQKEYRSLVGQLFSNSFLISNIRCTFVTANQLSPSIGRHISITILQFGVKQRRLTLELGKEIITCSTPYIKCEKLLDVK